MHFFWNLAPARSCLPPQIMGEAKGVQYIEQGTRTYIKDKRFKKIFSVYMMHSLSSFTELILALVCNLCDGCQFHFWHNMTYFQAHEHKSMLNIGLDIDRPPGCSSESWHSWHCSKNVNTLKFFTILIQFKRRSSRKHPLRMSDMQ
jgi:hypothetical protein